MFFKITLFILLFYTTKCSLVIDSLSQKGLYVSDYCPKMKYCAEGAHVMCMYYNPKQVMGPRCSNPKNVTITPELASKLVDVSNAVRSKIALGKEKGKGGQYLPRGYGVFRLDLCTCVLCAGVCMQCCACNAQCMGSVTVSRWRRRQEPPQLGNETRLGSPPEGDPESVREYTHLFVQATQNYVTLEKWDDELATFAQVLANQCVLRHDMCRATKRFPDPGQTAGLVRFSYPDWYPVSKAGHFTTPGLNVPKLIYATTQALKSWYGQKNSVTTDMITSYPDWTENPNNQGGRLYLEMIYGPATHMGCGISAYTEYAFYDNNAALNYNSVQIICNYSSRPRKNGIVYNTTAPVTSDFTPRCGCPPGTIEDDDCLCHQEVTTHPTPLLQPVRKCLGGSCDPTVVVLPIFTVEDAPQDKLLTMPRNKGTPTRRQDSSEFIDIFNEPNKHHITYNFQPTLINDNDKYQNTARSSLVNTNSLDRGSRKRILDVKNRHFGKMPHPTLSKYQRTSSFGTLTDHTLHKKQSIFSRQAKFVLPTNNVNGHSVPPFIFKKDVLPRKDFTRAQKLVNSYLEKNKHIDEFRTKSQLNMRKNKYDEAVLSNHEIYHNNLHGQGTETVLHTAEDKIINFNQYLRHDNSTPFVDGRETADSDRRLMVLLDNLEKEVKNIELHGSEKKIFDAKIRKIYGKVVGRPDNLIEGKQRNFDKDFSYDSNKGAKNYLHRNNDIDNNFNRNEIADDVKVNNYLQEIHDFDVEPYNKYSADFEYNRGQLSRNQNTMTDDEKQNYYSNAANKGSKILNSYVVLPSHGRSVDNVKIRNTYKSDFEGGFKKNSINEIPKTGIRKQKNWATRGDPLTLERRKYYQDKLEKLERRLQNTRSYKRRTELESNKQARRMRPTDDYHRRRAASKKQIDPFYMPERARFLHSYR